MHVQPLRRKINNISGFSTRRAGNELRQIGQNVSSHLPPMIINSREMTSKSMLAPPKPMVSSQLKDNGTVLNDNKSVKA